MRVRGWTCGARPSSPIRIPAAWGILERAQQPSGVRRGGLGELQLVAQVRPRPSRSEDFYHIPGARRVAPRHSTGSNVGFLDGHVKWQTADSILTFRALPEGRFGGRAVRLLARKRHCAAGRSAFRPRYALADGPPLRVLPE